MTGPGAVGELRLTREHRDRHLRAVVVALVDARRQAGMRWSQANTLAWQLALRGTGGAQA
jgi:hypothetical protein